MKYWIIILNLLSIVYVQTFPPIEQLIEQSRKLFTVHNTLEPLFYQEKIHIDSLAMPNRDKKDLKNWLQKEKKYIENQQDSIAPGVVIEFLNEKICDYLDVIIRHPNFFEYNISEEIGIEELNIIISDDQRLINFSFDEKTGGSYQSRISRLYLFDKEIDKIIDISEMPFVYPDGYKKISILKSEHGVKYVLESSVKTCNQCFTTFIQLINSNLKEVFVYSSMHRNLNDGAFYNPKTQTIQVHYQTDDLTPNCNCENNTDTQQNAILTCNCTFVFNGYTFERTFLSRR